MCRVVDRGHQVRVHVVHVLAMKQLLAEAERNLVPLSHFVPPMLENRREVRRDIDFLSNTCEEANVRPSRKSEDNLGKVFLKAVGARPPL